MTTKLNVQSGLPTTAVETAQKSRIVLSTLNARYIHCAFGLRYLKANLGDLQSTCAIEEFTLESRPEDVVEAILRYQPEVVGFGVYIWNIRQTEMVVDLLKAVAPQVIVILGGPEVSYEHQQQKIVQQADYLITGWGDVSFAALVTQLLEGKVPTEKVIAGEQPKLDQIASPYHLYTDEDINNRVLYVEASRGCPFKCEFCLSALDKTAWPFDLEMFLSEMDDLYQRGARHFKFVDRTFNLKIKNSLQILQFFLDRIDDDLFLHYEVIPDHLPEALQEMIARFPAGSLQFEIGIQTFNPEVQSTISRRQNNQQAKQNITWIIEHSNAHVHADLIFGLPGETLESFADSFNQLHALAPHEIQVGILKRLKGSPIVRHTAKHQLVFNPNPPFNILSSDTVDFQTLQEINRFARYWDLVGNSGRFKQTLYLLLADNAYANFATIANAIFARTGQTYKISLLRLFDIIFAIATEELQLDAELIKQAIQSDFNRSGLKSIPKCLLKQKRRDIAQAVTPSQVNSRSTRQSRH